MEKKKLHITFNAPVVLSFTIICAIALLAGYLTQGKSTAMLFTCYRDSVKNPLTYIRLFTHVFGHADFSHLSGNMFIFLMTGPLLEEKYGSRFMLLVIAVVSLTTGLFNIAFFPYSGLLGASGVCFAMILLSSITGVKKGEIPLTFLLVAVLYLGEQLISGFSNHDDIAQFAHIIGGVVGAAAGFGIVNTRSI